MMHTLVSIRTDVDRPSAWLATAIVTIVLVSVLGTLGMQVFKWDQKVDDYLRFGLLFIGLGGFLLQYEPSTKVLTLLGDAIRSFINGAATMVNEDWVTDVKVDVVYTVFLALVIGLLVRSIVKNSRDGGSVFGWPFVVLIALAAPFFLNGLLGRVTNWYVDNIGVGVWNFINP